MNDDELYYKLDDLESRIYNLESRITELEYENKDLNQRIDQLKDVVLDAYDDSAEYTIYHADWYMSVFFRFTYVIFKNKK